MQAPDTRATSGTDPLKRPLSGPERGVWKRDCISLNIVMCARINGVISRDGLKDSWAILRNRHPLLRAHLEQEADSFFLVFTGTGQIPIREVSGTTNYDWQSEALKELQTPFDTLSINPLVRSVLLHTPDGIDLIVTCHHAVSDALSVAYLIRDCLHCLAGEEHLVPDSVDTPVTGNSIPKAVRLSPLTRAALAVADFIFGRPIHSGLCTSQVPMQETRLLAWNFSRAQTKALIAACKQRKITVHAAVSTLFQAAQSAVQGDTKSIYKKIYTPVSVRASLEGRIGERFGLFASEAYIPCRYNTRKSFWENASINNDSIRRKTGAANVLKLLLMADALKPEAIDRITVFMMKRLSSTYFGYIISNLGNLDFPDRYNSLQLRELHGPIIYIPQVEKTLTLLTFKQKMFFTLCYQPAVLSPEITKSIRDEVQRFLDRALGSH